VVAREGGAARGQEVGQQQQEVARGEAREQGVQGDAEQVVEQQRERGDAKVEAQEWEVQGDVEQVVEQQQERGDAKVGAQEQEVQEVVQGQWEAVQWSVQEWWGWE